ncbi:MAG: baseplate protein [Caudoviricetes sp.]|nr:MAG: baseplate protein [Caudoviricetes sp.]
MPTWVGYSSVDDTKKSNKLYDIELIKQDYLNQFMSAKGSRLRMPEWGCIIWNKLFDGYNDTMRDEIEEDCIRIINSDTRVELQSIEIEVENHLLKLSMLLKYTPQNINFDMFLTYNTNLSENQ